MKNKAKKSKIEKFWWALRKARNLTLRRLPSKHHEESWKNFEKVMEYRANFFMSAKIILFAYNLYTGDMQYMLSEKAINEGLIANVDLARKVWPIAHIAVWVWFILCCILFLASKKYMILTRLYWYLMIVMHGVEIFLPYDISEASSNYVSLVGVTT